MDGLEDCMTDVGRLVTMDACTWLMGFLLSFVLLADVALRARSIAIVAA